MWRGGPATPSDGIKMSLSSDDLERLLFTLETSIKVNKPFQFFLWAQGTLQSFLPHETLVCAYGNLMDMRLRQEVFSRTVLSTGMQAALMDPVSGVVPSLIGVWQARQRTPSGVPAEASPNAGRWCAAEGHLLCHGAREARDDQGSFFVFLNMPEVPGEREYYLADLLMPHMHMALQRVFGANGKVVERAPLEAQLTGREIQVLERMRDGKTNHEIGAILRISPLTVKNHVQNILRKLEVSNRTQAVAKGDDYGLFGKRAEGRHPV